MLLWDWEHITWQLLMTCTADLDGSLIAPSLDKTLSSSERRAVIQSVLQATSQQGSDSRTATIFDAKEQYKVLSRYCAVALDTRCMDPKVACWLLDPASNEKNLHCMVTNYCPLEMALLQGWLSSLFICPLWLSEHCTLWVKKTGPLFYGL